MITLIKSEVPVPVRVAVELRNLAYALQQGSIRKDCAADVLDMLAHLLEKWIEVSK